MREIKFRAWFEGEMLSNEQLVQKDQNTTCVFTILTENPQKDDVVFMQYTGLKDENDKEIYEGDIVRHATDEGIYKVIFDDGGFYVKNLFEYDFQTIDEYPLEVIGNIYENPELIN